MASPLKSGKQSIQLPASAPRGSRIRRDPPPVAKQTAERDPSDRDAQIVIIGVVTFVIVIALVIVGFGNAIN